MYGIGNLQSSPAMKTFYNKALLSATGSDIVHDYSLVRQKHSQFILIHVAEEHFQPFLRSGVCMTGHFSTSLITSSQPLMLLLAVFVYDSLT